jgi:murein hydrolase activator
MVAKLMKLMTHILLITSAICALPSIAYQDEKKQLDTVKSEIKTQRATIKQIDSKKEKLEKQLKANELAISEVAKVLSNTNKKKIDISQKIAKINADIKITNSKKQQQETVLAKQLKTAYASGQHDYLKMLLSQDASQDTQRTLTYYQYLNEARVEAIDSFKQTILNLKNLEEEALQQEHLLAEVLSQQKQEQEALKSKQAERKQTIAQLNKRILSSEERLAKLLAEEQYLAAEIQRLAELAKRSTQMNGLAKLKKKLRWPVKGRIIKNFGARKQGYLKWKGILMRAKLGQSVNAIHGGKVLFSDWLKGYGLVTVVDHGKGYMSLYGHNQALLKSVGDTVESGEPIALAGQSGGQATPSLYFEIRYQGKAVNPRSWFN